MNSPMERKTVIQRVSNKLKQNDNILCSMEAAWNLSSNSLVNKFFSGMIYAAYDANALILPVAIERFNSKLYSVNVSDIYFDSQKYFKNVDINKENVKKYTEEIRQKLANLKFETYFDDYIYKKIFMKRSKIGDYDMYNIKFKNDILKGWNFNESDIRRKGYIQEDSPQKVYEYIVEMFKLKIEKKVDFTNEQYALLVQELKNEIDNEIYPNEIHNELVNLYKEIQLEEKNFLKTK